MATDVAARGERTGTGAGAPWTLGAIVAVIAATVAVMVAARAPGDDGELGRRLFFGEAPLRAAIVGHDEPLPQDAVRCANCHENAPTPAPRSSASASASASPLDATQTLGPSLDRISLTNLASRRGGPPSSYDARSFCRVLGEGIDPAHVMIPQTMPRYAMTKDECEALWTFLTAR